MILKDLASVFLDSWDYHQLQASTSRQYCKKACSLGSCTFLISTLRPPRGEPQCLSTGLVLTRQQPDECVQNLLWSGVLHKVHLRSLSSDPVGMKEVCYYLLLPDWVKRLLCLPAPVFSTKHSMLVTFCLGQFDSSCRQLHVHSFTLPCLFYFSFLALTPQAALPVFTPRCPALTVLLPIMFPLNFKFKTKHKMDSRVFVNSKIPLGLVQSWFSPGLPFVQSQSWFCLCSISKICLKYFTSLLKIILLQYYFGRIQTLYFHFYLSTCAAPVFILLLKTFKYFFYQWGRCTRKKNISLMYIYHTQHIPAS